MAAGSAEEATPSHFVSDYSGNLWHVSDETELQIRCGTDIIVASKVLIDKSAFSARYQVCLACAPEAGTPDTPGGEATMNEARGRREAAPVDRGRIYVQAELALGLEDD